MNAFSELWRAAVGWLDLLTGKAGADEKFNLSRVGLINATGFYFAVVMLTIAVESSLGGFPGWPQIGLSVALNAVLLGAIWLIAWITARLMHRPALAVTVPSTYAMGFVLAVSLPLVYLASPAVLLVLLGVRAFMFYRAARGMGKLSIGISAAFAILCIAALAAIPLGLYMLTSGGQGIG